MTSGYVYGSAEEAEAAFANKKQRFIYSRFSNPTVQMFEDRMALLEGAEAARATSTGMAAVFASLACQLRAGDRVVASDALFGSCQYVLAEILPRFGVETVFVDGRDLGAMAQCPLAQDPGGLRRDAVEPGLAHHRCAGGGQARPCRGRQAHRRQCLRHPAAAAALGAGRRYRRLFRDQAYRRPGPRHGRRDPGQQGLGRGELAALPAPYRPGPQPDERLAAAEGAGDPGASRLAPLQQRRAHRRFPGQAEEGRASFSTPASPAIPSMRSRASR